MGYSQFILVGGFEHRGMVEVTVYSGEVPWWLEGNQQKTDAPPAFGELSHTVVTQPVSAHRWPFNQTQFPLSPPLRPSHLSFLFISEILFLTTEAKTTYTHQQTEGLRVLDI